MGRELLRAQSNGHKFVPNMLAIFSQHTPRVDTRPISTGRSRCVLCVRACVLAVVCVYYGIIKLAACILIFSNVDHRTT